MDKTQLRKKASAYAPGWKRDAGPRTGFGLKAEAQGGSEGFRTVDPYRRYTDATELDQIFTLLQSEAGRQALGAQMAIPIRQNLDYQGMARRWLEIDVLAQGQIARYDRDIDGFAASVSKRGEVIDFIVEGDTVSPTTWEILAPEAIRLSEIQQRRFNVLDRMQERVRIAVQIEEDTQFLALIETTVAANTANNPVTASAAGASKSVLNDLSAEIMKFDLPAYGFLMNMKTYSHIRSWGSAELDPVTQREILQTGLMGNLWGIDIVVSRLVQPGVIYCFSEPRFNGVMPIRTDLILMPDDQPKRALVGFVGYEEIGMSWVTSNAAAKATFTGGSTSTTKPT